MGGLGDCLLHRDGSRSLVLPVVCRVVSYLPRHRRGRGDVDGGPAPGGDEPQVALDTLSAYLDRWLDGSVKGFVKPSTYESYERVIRTDIKPALGHKKLKVLAPNHVQYFYQSKLDAGLASGTVRLMHGILHKALDQAVKWGIVTRNVCKATMPPKPNPEEIRPLDAEQVKRILEAFLGNRLEALYVLAVTAGLRIGELLGLKWEDIDLGAESLHVRRTRSQAKTGPTFTAPKNGKGRSIRLTRRAVEVLKAHKVAQNAERLKAGSLWQDNSLVFCTHAGKPLDFRNVVTASFKPLLKKAKLPDIRFHDLRHTCATLLLSRCHHPKLVQELLSHTSVAMTLDRYLHVLPGWGTRLPLLWRLPCCRLGSQAPLVR